MQTLWTLGPINFTTSKGNRKSQKLADDGKGKKRRNEHSVRVDRKDKETFDWKARGTPRILEGSCCVAGHIKDCKGEKFITSPIFCVQFVSLCLQENE